MILDCILKSGFAEQDPLAVMCLGDSIRIHDQNIPRGKLYQLLLPGCILGYPQGHTGARQLIDGLSLLASKKNRRVVTGIHVAQTTRMRFQDAVEGGQE